jgi:hydroxypyruvate isomerase
MPGPVVVLLVLATQGGPCRTAACTDAEVETVYRRGWEAAEAAAKVGGSTESLAPVRDAIALLDRMAGGTPGPAEIARYVLAAAADAAQDERDEMALFLEHAVALERTQLDAHQSAAPGITAHEAAGELWLRVYRYEDAKRAYERARAVIGSTPRIESGLARAEDALRR